MLLSRAEAGFLLRAGAGWGGGDSHLSPRRRQLLVGENVSHSTVLSDRQRVYREWKLYSES